VRLIRNKQQRKTPSDESSGQQIGWSRPHRPAPRAAPAQKSAGSSGSWLLIITLAILATTLCYRAFSVRFDRGIRRAVISHLRELFPGAEISVGHVTQDAMGKLIVTELRMLSRHRTSEIPLFTAERILLRGNLQLQDIVRNRVRVSQVDLHGVQCEVWPLEGGGWSVQALTPRPKPQSRAPKIAFHDLIVRLRKSEHIDAPVTTLHNISGSLVQEVDAGKPNTAIQVNLAGESNGTVDHFQVAAQLSAEAGSCQLHGSFQKLRFSRSLLDNLPSCLSSYLTQLSGLECEASARFEIISHSGQPPAFRLLGQLSEGRLQDPRFPYLLQNLHSEFACENTQLQLRNMRADSGHTRLELNTDLYGLRPDSPMTIEAKVENLDLDQKLYQSLPANLRYYWDRLQLSGQVSGDVKLLFDGHRWTPSMSVQCEGVTIRPWLFPYPISDIRGHVIYRDAQISSSYVEGRAGGQTAHGSFSLTKGSSAAPGDSTPGDSTPGDSTPGDSTSTWYGRLEFSSEGPVSVDEQLLSALTPRDEASTDSEVFVRSLRPSGTLQLTKAIFYRQSEVDCWHKRINANVYSGSILYTGFKYPIEHIRGHIICDDANWWLDQFEGRNDSGRILCSGSWSTDTQGSIPFDLHFDAFAVPIEEELKLALPAEAQFVWNELQPQGAIDRIEVRLQRTAGNPDVHTTVEVTEESRSNAASNRSLRLAPKAFPYRLIDVDCRISYSPGLVLIEKASGLNGGSRIALKGKCEPQQDGRWKASVEWLPQTRLIVESQLLKALPKSIRESLVKIDFRGPISILGQSQVLFAGRQNESIATSWNCQIAVEDGQLADGRHIGALRGTLFMKGYSDGSQIKATGSLALDALTVLGVPVTRLTGPFALLNSNLYFGRQVYDVLPQANQQQPTEMTANALSGC
jgi:hypothetical protein